MQLDHVHSVVGHDRDLAAGLPVVADARYDPGRGRLLAYNLHV